MLISITFISHCNTRAVLKMKSMSFLIFIFAIFERLYCRSANDFLKDVFSLDEPLHEEKCSTIECQTAGKCHKFNDQNIKDIRVDCFSMSKV